MADTVTGWKLGETAEDPFANVPQDEDLFASLIPETPGRRSAEDLALTAVFNPTHWDD